MENLYMAFVHDVIGAATGQQKGLSQYADAVDKLIVASDFQADVQNGLVSIASEEAGNTTSNPWLQLFAQFLQQDLVSFLDSGSLSGKYSSVLDDQLRQLTDRHTAEDLQAVLAQTLRKTGIDTVWVRSAYELKLEMKAKLRQKFAKSFVVFALDRSLIGGIQVYSKGKLMDATWAHELQHILKTAT